MTALPQQIQKLIPSLKSKTEEVRYSMRNMGRLTASGN